MAFPEVGDTLDIFVLRSELHEGAMATLFLAEDLLSKEKFVFLQSLLRSFICACISKK